MNVLTPKQDTHLESRFLVVPCIVHSLDMQEAKVVASLYKRSSNLLSLDMKL